MSKKRCIVEGCPSLHKLFTLPAPKERRDVWLEMVQREDLSSLPYSTLKSYGVCAAHFPPAAFTDASQRKLCLNSFPTGISEESGQTGSVTPPEEITPSNFDTSPTKCDDKVLRMTTRTYGRVGVAPEYAAGAENIEMPSTSRQPVCRNLHG
ncbi:hypothetical protein RN001_003766 [Aquatica leii]|uniref:THAP-type domain-containing protein n=1 Tax=Aquatica leii TaxID=1421715 RepID=A0AAN7QBX6_9COLE|nr:hypothetical protein RN001_003766 [Aquatica leii]